ncbi:hypothetical protein JL108_07225 [Aeromicrobium sp. YIM 150415]|uniref:Secreted protein n=1 Tax=Aeromicrobium piscarium TaxID=2590901 RepID=A0A554SB61_9ACTN|nr:MULTISPECIES: hypothetical protein [Aeromicrobium]MBM9463236.1 hypothetical protein [Aeromicrobium sp. YIM 150415]TSD63576.1 hypothetical protein FNM00_08145 [Aeromicrobium piscarium]
MSLVRAFTTLVAAVAAVLVATAGPAAASTAPFTWEQGESLSTLYVVGIFAGVPLALFVVIWIFGAATARNNYVPPAPSTEVEKADAHH